MTQSKSQQGRGRRAPARRRKKEQEPQVTVRLLTGRSDGETTWYAGDEITVGAREAEALLNAGSAEAIAELPKDQAEQRA